MHTKRQHFKDIFGTWWTAVNSVWTLLSSADALVDHYGSTDFKRSWDAAWITPKWGWKVWIIGIAVTTAAFAVEYSYRQIKRLEAEIDDLSWPANRPNVLFESWGEPPHDDPRARFHLTNNGTEREYFERGFFVLNDGDTAHEVTLGDIEVLDGLTAHGDVLPRIDAKGKAFAFIWLDIEQTSSIMGRIERWDLLSVMSYAEKIVNANSTSRILIVPVKAYYRDSRNVWYGSTAKMSYSRDTNAIQFGASTQFRVRPRDGS
jgi:hypothetical protein